MMAYSEDHTALAAEYALGTLDAEERALVEAMMSIDKDFAAVVEAWEHKLGALNQMVGSVEPRAEVWDNIRTAIGLSGSQAPLVMPQASPPPVAAEIAATFGLSWPLVIANLAQFVPASDASFGMQPLPSPPCTITCPPEFAETNTDPTDAQSDPDAVAPMFELECHDPDDFSVHHRYFKFNGVFYCLERPAIACLPTAA